jgi:hypothetical protein
MTSTVLTFLIIVLLLAAAWSWRDPDAPRHVSLGGHRRADSCHADRPVVAERGVDCRVAPAVVALETRERGMMGLPVLPYAW